MKMLFASQIVEDSGLGSSTREERLFVNSVGYYEIDEAFGATYRKNGRKDYYLSYNHSGRMKLKIRQKYYEISEGTVFIYSPNEEQYYGQADRNEPISNYWVHFTGYGAYELLILGGLDEGGIFQTGVSDDIAALFIRIIDGINMNSKYSKNISAAYLELLILGIAGRVNNMIESQEKGPAYAIKETIHHIHKHYSDNITVSNLAREAGINHNGYTRAFKQITGLAPKEYIIYFRLQKSKELILNSNLNIRQISQLTGFDNQMYFSRLFKKYEGCTPTEYFKKASF